MANVGEQLLQPENGWQRIDNDDGKIGYSGYWNKDLHNSCYNGAVLTSTRKGDTVDLYVYCNKFRFISETDTNRQNINQCAVYIDDIHVKDISTYGELLFLYLAFEYTFESYGFHHIRLLNIAPDGRYIPVDAFDIDEDGCIISKTDYNLMKSYEINTPSIGDRLPCPQADWKRIDDRNELINYYGEWLYQAGTENTNGGSTIINPSASLEQIQSAYAEFYFFGSKIRIINAYYEQSSMKYTMEIDGEKIITSSNGTLTFQCIISEKLNLDKKPHKVKIYSGDDKRISLDAIDIDEDGYLMTEEQYLEQSQKPQKQNNFPVKVADDSITSEEDVANYSSTLTNGERQLLIADKLNGIYLTDGQGRYTKINEDNHNNRDVLDSFSRDKNGSLLFNGKPIETDLDTSIFLNREAYDSDNDGIIDNSKAAERIKGIESAPLFSVYGKSPNGVEGFYEFPIGYIDDQTNKFQSVRQNAKANEVYTIELIQPNKLNDLIIQAYEFVQGEQDVVTTLKEFNNSDSDNFYYDKDNLTFTTNGTKIKNEYEIDSISSDIEEGLYEVTIEDYLDIDNIACEVII